MATHSSILAFRTPWTVWKRNFPVVMYGCESWTIKKAEHRRIAAFELWCWRRLLRVPWTARRSNQSILKEISPGCSLEGLMLRLKLQYFGHLMPRADSFVKTLMLERWKAGGDGDDRGWDGWMASPTQWRWVWASSGRRWKTGKPGVLYVVHGVAMNQTRLNDWATTFNFAISNLGCPPFLTWSLVQPPTWTLCLHPLPPYSILYLAVRGMVLKL